MSLTQCTAVGFDGTLGSEVGTLAEKWTGSAWAFQLTPNPAVTKWLSGLSSVGCTGAAACTAVGAAITTTGNAQELLAEHWNGTRWTIEFPPNPADMEPTMNGVNCPTSTTCEAVGFYVNGSGTQRPLAERWSRNTWSIQSTPG